MKEWEPDLFSYRRADAREAAPAPSIMPTPPSPPSLAAVPDTVDRVDSRPAPTPIIPDRQPLTVALADDAFDWFHAGEKVWELRRRGRQFNDSEVVTGRAVALRRGFRSEGELTGCIAQVVQAASVEAFFDEVTYQDVVPVGESREEAVAVAKQLLGPGAPSGPVIGFRLEIDRRDAGDGDRDGQVRPPALVRKPARRR